MKRLFEKELSDWKATPDKKPLVIYGARQVGKTTSVRDFTSKNYNLALEVNFIERPDLKAAFQGSLNPGDVLKNIHALTGEKICVGDCLFLDEIQECDEAISSLKFFNDKKTGVDVIVAGSTLGVHIARSASFPVGNVTIKKMHPMNFEEFCTALGEGAAFSIAKKSSEKKSFCPVHDKLMMLLYNYLLVGGMPESVKKFAKTKDVESVRQIQDDIITAYVADMAKYIQNLDATKVINCWNSIPSQLAKENNSTKFAWKNVEGGAGKRSHGSAIDWLANSGIVNRLNAVTDGASPLASFENRDAFKIYSADTGLLSRMYRAKITDFDFCDSRSARFRGGIIENFVMQELVASGNHPYYWGVKSRHEVDFVISTQQGIVPIEVKSGNNTRATSASYFANKYDCPKIIKLSTKNFGEHNGIDSIPLYAAGLIKEEPLS